MYLVCTSKFETLWYKVSDLLSFQKTYIVQAMHHWNRYCMKVQRPFCKIQSTYIWKGPDRIPIQRRIWYRWSSKRTHTVLCLQTSLELSTILHIIGLSLSILSKAKRTKRKQHKIAHEVSPVPSLFLRKERHCEEPPNMNSLSLNTRICFWNQISSYQKANLGVISITGKVGCWKIVKFLVVWCKT